ncbi:ABC transporter permease [Humisphaera borealis]|uniref:ABC transporter permease n=1 Tax=Humisphaera borealis TaxID=2807512 RepID=A0A7M2WU45_9BACT|nr:ABC transporter permease [Humisphaera borealis]QOV89047.1 ABC transporter permease [Humisphaera borealis]
MRFLGWIGSSAIDIVRRWIYLASVIYSVLMLVSRPTTWRRTVREVLARQILFTGVEAVRFTAAIAFFVGIAVVVQAQLWLQKIGQVTAVGPLLVAVIVREVGPLLANVIVLVRSGNAITVELANMRQTGELRVLDAQGLDPLLYLVVPRVIGVMLSVFCLSVILITTSLLTGYIVALALDLKVGTPAFFLRGILSAITAADVPSVAARSLLPGMIAACICCTEGLSVGGAQTDVPRAVTRAVQRSFVSLFVTSVLISVVTYV